MLRQISAFVLSSLLSFASFACESITIETLPFEPRVEFLPMQELNKQHPGDRILNGAVVTTANATFDPNSCVLTVGWQDVAVKIAEELNDDECAVRYIAAHEMQHVEIYVTALAGSKQQVQGYMLNGASPIDSVKMFFQDVNRKQVAIDTPESEAETLNACNRAIPWVISRAMRGTEVYRKLSRN